MISDHSSVSFIYLSPVFTSSCALRLELWPGFITSILQYENNVMLCADISHKILRTDTVYDYLKELEYTGRGNFYEQATRALVGEIVLTK